MKEFCRNFNLFRPLSPPLNTGDNFFLEAILCILKCTVICASMPYKMCTGDFEVGKEFVNFI